MLFNLVLFASPLTKLGEILRTRNSTSLPIAMTTMFFSSNAMWTIYGHLIEDMVVHLSSVLGFILSTFQLLVIAWCRHLLPFDLGFLLHPMSLIANQEKLP